MDVLQSYHYNMLQNVETGYVRSLYQQIQWNQRMLAIKGPRGSGKTTLMLQHLVAEHGADNELAFT